jgi:hypothetical protein
MVFRTRFYFLILRPQRWMISLQAEMPVYLELELLLTKDLECFGLHLDAIACL